MEDTLISFDTALLAKEKGFNNINCKAVYENTKEYDFDEDTWTLYNKSINEKKQSKNKILCPTQSLLQKWLREVHNIHIEIYSHNNDWYFILQSTHYPKSFEFKSQCEKDYQTYEEALEEALQESLKLINNE